MLFRMGITVTSPKLPEDKRLCLFCHQFGDGVSDGPSRYILFIFYFVVQHIDTFTNKFNLVTISIMY